MAAAAMKKLEGDATVHRLVVGMGKTGFSLAIWLARNGHAFAAVDSRVEPPLAERFHRELPGHVLHTGGFDAALLAGADELLLSPGVDPAEPAIAAAAAHGARVFGDIGHQLNAGIMLCLTGGKHRSARCAIAATDFKDVRIWPGRQ